MPSQGRYAIVGAFVIGGLVLFAVGLFMVGNRRLLFTDRFEVHTTFQQVAGLQVGAKVRVAGMDAGEVLSIQVPPGPAQGFRVRMRIRADLHDIVRTDSVATIQTDGLVGSKFVQVDAGSAQAPRVADGGAVIGREPFDLADLMQQMSETVQTANEAVVSLKQDLDETLAQVSETVGHADRLIQDVGVDVRAITASTRAMAVDANVIIENVRAGRGTVGRYGRATSIARKAEETVDHIREASLQARTAISDFRSPEGPVQGTAGDLRQTLTYAREAMAGLAENVEALKRNWFFRGFFERRGYYDLDALTLDEYRRGALEGKDRAKLQIWLQASVLFTTNPEGLEFLADDGRARLDSAMAEFLRYPRDSPIVVEGYARGATRDARYLRSRDRAAMVREYLVAKFHLTPTAVGIMPSGDDAPGSPAGETWDGVALALFADRAAIVRATSQPPGPGGGTAQPAARPVVSRP
jgi:phospholipid/cholesterol/gamma-HCH transport system substrate-binding protein